MTTHIPLQPLYSLACPEFKRITLVAKDPTGDLKRIYFDGVDNFNESFCKCCPRIAGINEFEYPGILKAGFQKSHQDITGRSLLCIGVTDNKMDLFVAPDGHMDRYQWNKEKKAYQKTEDLSITFLKGDIADNPSDKLMDSQLTPIMMGECPLHQKMLLAYTPTSNDLDPYRWNRRREQFERITCRCEHVVQRNAKKLRENLNVLMDVKSGEVEHLMVVVENQKLYKLVMNQDEDGAPAYVKPAVVRDLRGLDSTALSHLRYIDWIVYEIDYKYHPKIEKSWFLYPGKDQKMTIIDETGQLTEVDKPETMRIPSRCLKKDYLTKCHISLERYQTLRRELPMGGQDYNYWKVLFKKSKALTPRNSSRTSSAASTKPSESPINPRPLPQPTIVKKREKPTPPPPMEWSIPDHRIPSTSTGTYYEEDIPSDSESMKKPFVWKDFGGEVEKFSEMSIGAARSEETTEKDKNDKIVSALADNGII